MFDRVIYSNWHVIFPIAAFIVAAVIFSAMCWRALRMQRGQVEHFSRLPLADDEPPAPPHP